MFQHYILTMVAILSFNTKAGLVATASRARGETTSRARGVITELSPAAGLRELVLGVRSHSNGVSWSPVFVPTAMALGLVATAAMVSPEAAVIVTASGERGRP